MILSDAKHYSRQILGELKPFCERSEIAGSIRREKQLCRDIEIVCIPKKIVKPVDLFFSEKSIHSGFIEAVNKYEKVKGEPTGKYTQRVLPGNIKVDIFIADENNWGLILAIRTGSAEFSHSLAKEWVRQGYHAARGILYYGYEPHFIREEIDLFKLLKISWVPPQRRIEGF